MRWQLEDSTNSRFATLHLQPSSSMEIIENWVDLIDENGWIAREQILGDEARSKVCQWGGQSFICNLCDLFSPLSPVTFNDARVICVCLCELPLLIQFAAFTPPHSIHSIQCLNCFTHLFTSHVQVPSEFQVQFQDYANPPTLMLPIMELVRILRSLEQQKEIRFGTSTRNQTIIFILTRQRPQLVCVCLCIETISE